MRNQRGLSTFCAVLLSLTGGACCSPTTTTRPTLPAGKPDRLHVDGTAWVESGSRVSIPADDVRELLLKYHLWRAWSLDLERAGDWQ